MIRQKAEGRAREIAGEAYDAKGKLEDYEATARALENRIKKYDGVYLVPPAHILDEMAEQFGFSKAGEKLKLARERTKLMQANGTAATCGYADGWKKDHALKFVLSTFNGKVDTVLSRVKPDNQGKLIQEIKDAYAMVNRDGEVYKNARIQKEYLDSRLEELKCGAAVQKLKEKTREEQRAIREQIREEQKARREIERAIKQAEREEELVNKAIAKIMKQYEEASEADRAKLEAQLRELNVKLDEADRELEEVEA
jgi:multidrug resistance efflux pump